MTPDDPVYSPTMRHLTNHERRSLTPAQRALVNIDPAERVKDLQAPDVGGYTVNAITGQKATEGISVSRPGHEEVHKTESLNKENIARWAVHPARIRAITTGTHYGGWTEDGESYLDLSTVHPDSPEGRVSARQDMVRGQQLASYNLGTGVTERNPLHPGTFPKTAVHAREQMAPTAQSQREYVSDARPMGSARLTMYEPKDPKMRRGFS